MEEEIKTINRIIEFYKDLDEMHGKRKCPEISALENLLQAYKELESKYIKLIDEIRRIRDKVEIDDAYFLIDALVDLDKLLGEEENKDEQSR